MKPDRGITSRRKLGLIESDDNKSRFSAVRFRADKADFGEDSRIFALDAAEKLVGQTGWRRGWDSDPRYGLTARKLFILRNATNAKIAINAESRYTAGTRVHSRLTCPSFCTTANERVYITAKGCETDLGGG